MTLQDTFYIVGIVTMSLMLLIMLGTMVAVFIIKSKINHLHRIVEDKVQTVANVAQTAKSLFSRFKK